MLFYNMKEGILVQFAVLGAIYSTPTIRDDEEWCITVDGKYGEYDTSIQSWKILNGLDTEAEAIAIIAKIAARITPHANGVIEVGKEMK